MKDYLQGLQEEMRTYHPDDRLVRQVYDYLDKHMSYGVVLPSLIASDLVLPIFAVYHVLEKIRKETGDLEQYYIPRCPNCGSYAYKIATYNLTKLPEEIACPDCGTVNKDLFMNSIVAYRWKRNKS